MCSNCSLAKLACRAGSPPRTNPRTPHVQLDQNAPAEFNARMIALSAGLDGVHLGRSGISAPDTVAFLLDAEHARQGPRDAFMAPKEFAHVHAIHDGSLHMTLPRHALPIVLSRNWGEPHPLAGVHASDTLVMIYGPRDEAEFKVVEFLLNMSYGYATGVNLPEA